MIIFFRLHFSACMSHRSSIGCLKWLQKFPFGTLFHWQFFFTYIFSVPLTFGACFTTGQWGELREKNAMFSVFLTFLFLFFWWSINFSQQNINLTHQKLELVIRNCHWNCKVVLYVQLLTVIYWFSSLCSNLPS